MNHDARSYSKHRPLYPSPVFAGLVSPQTKVLAPPLRILDLACGSGQSTASLAQSLAEVQAVALTACDPDPGMIAAARSTYGDFIDWRVAAAEVLPFPDSSFDAVTILSAYHWFDRVRADAEILRILRPVAKILIAEYQFPVALHHSELNTWIRRSFNETWKFPDQKPRGRLRDFTESLLTHPRIKSSRWDRLAMNQTLTPSELAGLLFSQARFIAHLRTLTPNSAQQDYQEEVTSRIASLMPGEGAVFDFRLTRVLAYLR